EGTRGLESAVVVGQEHADGVAVGVGGDEVAPAVPIDVHHGQGIGGVDRGDRAGRREGPVASAQEHAHVITELVGGEDIRVAVAVDVRHGHPYGSVPGG